MTTNWEPTDYHGIGDIPNGNSPELRFQVDCYGPKKNRVVPMTWFSTDKLKYLYPPKDYKVGGVGPDKWNATTFDRHYYPKENWTQHKVGTLELQTFKKFLKARNIERQLTAGVKKNLISDSDTPNTGISTGKRRKAATKEKESSQLTQQSNGSSNQNTASDDSRFFLDLSPGPLPPQITEVAHEDYNNLAELDGHTFHNLNNSTQVVKETNAANIGIESNLVTIPFSNIPPSEFTAGYPSLNLPITRSPTIDPLLLTPSTVNLLPSQSNKQLSPAIEIDSWGKNAASTGSHSVTTPFANNPPSQFTSGNPSLNLPSSSCQVVGQMLSAPSPTIDSSLLTPSTDPSRNFQTGQHQGSCCQGVLVELQNLQNEVRKLSSLIGNSLRSNSTHSNSRKVLDYHRSFVQNLIGDCPKNTVKNVVDLNTALKDPKLAISMVMVLVNYCKTCKTINSFANSVYDKLVSPGASQGMQWKSSERGSDCRQGLSHLDCLLAVIGVCIRGYGAERKIECSTSRVIELIQNARKLSSQVYRKSNNISDLEAKTSAKTSVPVSFPDENFCDVVGNLEQKISSLSDAVEKFVPQLTE